MKSLLQKIEILFEDEHILVIDKPAELLTIPDRFRDLPNIKGFFKRKYGDAFIVHRLDKDTSGVLILAKTEEAHKDLSGQFQDHKIKKTYLAFVKGTPEPDHGIIDAAIAEHKTVAGKMVVAKKGKQAITHYKVLENLGAYSLVEIDLKTGRTHQIRVHMSHIGFPLAVDAMYAKKRELLLSEIKKKRVVVTKHEEAERPLVKRHTLHSHSLSFYHPVTRKEMTITAELPKDLRALHNQLLKYKKD